MSTSNRISGCGTTSPDTFQVPTRVVGCPVDMPMHGGSTSANMRSMRTRRSPGSNRVAAALIAVALLLTACSKAAPPPTDTALDGPLPAYRGADVPTALEQGTVTVVEEDHRRCVGLEAGGKLYGALWPPGFEVRPDPYRIVDGEGRVVAEEGEVIELGGGVIPAARFPNPCRTEQLMVVGEL